MPTLNEKADGSGWYILAWTSDVGNITYQVEASIAELIIDEGLRDGEEISWTTVRALKTVGALSTKKSGVIGPDDFDPDPTELEGAELSATDAQSLYRALVSSEALSEATKRELRKVLEIGEPAALDGLADELVSYLRDQLSERGLPTREGEQVSSDWTSTEVWTNELDEEDLQRDVDPGEPHGFHEIHVLFTDDSGAETDFYEHCIHLCPLHGLEYWHVNSLAAPTMRLKVTGIEQQAMFVRWLVEALEVAGFELGDPTENIPPHVGVSEPTWSE